MRRGPDDGGDQHDGNDRKAHAVAPGEQGQIFEGHISVEASIGLETWMLFAPGTTASDLAPRL